MAKKRVHEIAKARGLTSLYAEQAIRAEEQDRHRQSWPQRVDRRGRHGDGVLRDDRGRTGAEAAVGRRSKGE